MLDSPDYHKIKREHFENMVAVALADGLLDEEEKEFLTEKAEEFGLSHQEAEAVIGNAENLEFMIPHNEVDREDQLTDAVYMSMINGKVSEKEYELCLHLAERLGFGKKDLDHIIDLIAKLWKVQQEKQQR